MFHPQFPYINKTVSNFVAEPLLVDIFREGTLVYEKPSLADIKDYAQKRLKIHWEEYTRTLNPEPFPVDLSQKLYDTKVSMIEEYTKKHSYR